ncbi:ThiF family adenylyltransferase [Ligilactobacillus agilis]|nr:ThiF family adenylyltransferase [Ligilactobacillus agilis]
MKYINPKVKPMLVPFINQKRTAIRIGGYQANIARDIEVDDVDEMYSFFKFLDGTNSLREIKNKYGLTDDTLLELLDTLKDEGIIYENNPSGFTKEETEFYSRAINFYAWIDINGKYYNYWDVQRKLKKSKVLVLGCGGTGSNTAVNLTRMGIGNIDILDMDTVEISNINRQYFEYNDVGEKKVIALEKKLKNINPFINVKSHDKVIQKSSDLLNLGTDYDVIVVCIDKPDNLYEILKEYTNKCGIPWILGGYASTVITQGIFDSKVKSFVDLISEDRKENFVARTIAENNDWNWDNAIISPIANISGSISSIYVLYYLTGLKDIEYGLVQHIDFYNIQNEKDFSYILGSRK